MAPAPAGPGFGFALPSRWSKAAWRLKQGIRARKRFQSAKLLTILCLSVQVSAGSSAVVPTSRNQSAKLLTNRRFCVSVCRFKISAITAWKRSR